MSRDRDKHIDVRQDWAIDGCNGENNDDFSK